ncbi:conserved hypothetical protein [Nostocoides australiense Ben110]|uniref:Phage head morphogenesis domain-containing protein n=1 Tax=Nostocoides australiense Ben110 TaxID=1193182 RepID=W6K4I7_9MICO|nr:hypothetical protein [Tetrasphaera australiensis]CCH75084.1 conserved hypothetical protein [Tetrasphaera australiensis Ben110]
MNAVEELLEQLSLAQQRRVLELWDRVEAGTITEEEFAILAANAVLVGNVAGYLIGAAVVRAVVEKATRLPEIVLPVPSARHLDSERISTALGTILASDLDTRMQLARLADNEPKAAAADGSADVIAGSRHVTGWTRNTNGEACQLCSWWARGGKVWPADHTMPRHPGCSCTQDPVVA